MKLIHYLALIAVLTATVFGARIITGNLEIPDFGDGIPVMQTEPATEAPTQEPTQAPTEAPTEPATEAPTEPGSFLLTFAGDCTLGCNAGRELAESAFPKTVGEDYKYPMANVLTYFEQDDYSFVNLEGVLGDKGNPQFKQFKFRGSSEYVKILTENSVECVTLANNHSFDYGQAGLDETKRILEEGGVAFADHKDPVLVTTETGLTIGVYAVDFTRKWPAKEELCSDIAALREAGAEVVVCSFHWGQENSYRTNQMQQEYGHLAIDSGADIVWGHHVYVLQPIEEYNGGVILYSLGNFVYGGNSAPKDLDTAIVQQEVIRQEDGSFALGQRTLIPCSVSSVPVVNNYQPTPYEVGSEEYNRAMSKLDGSYNGPNI